MRLRPLGLAVVLIAGCYPGGYSCSELPVALQCQTARDCARARTPENPCLSDVCRYGSCLREPADGLQADDKNKDCARPVCKNGRLEHIPDPTDAPYVGECHTVRCASDGSGPVTSLAADGTACSVGVCNAGMCEDYVPTTDKTTGLPCTNDDDCDKTGDGIAHCTDALYRGGPVDPTSICIQFDSPDVCTPTDATAVRLCDGDRGLCTRDGDSLAVCAGMCILRADGTWEKPCAGKNGCNVRKVDEAAGGVTRLFGTCGGGCTADLDCPSASLCDPTYRACLTACTVDADCRKMWPAAPSSWGCDVARGACAYAYAKKLGDPCTTKDDCLCFQGAGAAGGTCVTMCRPGDDCGAGFTCDALVPEDRFTFATQPKELVGRCLRDCTSDTDCATTETCARSAGLAQKTCRPK